MRRSLVFFILFLKLLSVSNAILVCVAPGQHKCHSNGLCLNISHLLQQANNYFTSGASIEFLPGNYTVENTSYVVVRDINGLTITVSTNVSTPDFHPPVTIDCNGRASLTFVNVTNLYISGIKFVRCGLPIAAREAKAVQTHSLYVIPPGVHAALSFANVSFLSINNVHVRECYGYGFPGSDLDVEEWSTALVETKAYFDNQYYLDNNNIKGEIRSDNETCPLWFYKNSNNSCQCGADLGTLHCNETLKEVKMESCFCMSSFKHKSQEIVVAGICIYTCNSALDAKPVHQIPFLIKLPPYNISKLEKLCYSTNRQGLMCGQCKDGFFPPVYSYDIKCVNCTNTDLYYNLGKYTLIALVPVTAFLLVIMCFRISAASPQLNAFILISQVMASLPSAWIFLPQLSTVSPTVKILGKSGLFLYGIWNLDFFRGLFSPICLNITTRQALAMDYIVAFYPMVLLAIVYILIELHDRNCRVLVWLWMPFHPCFARFRREWNIRASIIDAFATFLLLAYVKLLTVSAMLMSPIRLYNARGDAVGGFRAYFDGTVDLLDGIQIFYSVLVVLLSLIFIVFPPLLLILYPFSCFQRCLDRCCLHRHALNAFADAFQGCYKDGTNGDPDRRWFAAVYLLVRIAFFITYTLTVGQYFFPVATLLLQFLAILIVILQPYKKQYALYNKVDAMLVCVLASWYVSILGVIMAYAIQFRYVISSFIISALLFFSPLLYLTSIFLHWLFNRARFPQRLLHRCRLWRRVTARQRRESDADLLPDRIINPGNYGAVLQHAAVDDNTFHSENFDTY